MKLTILFGVLGFLSLAYIVQCCNQSVCASLVSKCQLIRSCDCDMSDKKNCTCCSNCQLCLAQLYSECCSCVEHEFSDGFSHSRTNCTVAFMSKCMSMNKCKQSCKSMGAAKYRWFQNAGCCQCIGDTCIDYGLNEPKCLLCKDDTDEEYEAKKNTDEMEKITKEDKEIEQNMEEDGV